MRKDASVLGAITVAAVLWSWPLRPEPDEIALPTDLAKYREWTQLLKSPYQVPMELWIRCTAPTRGDWERAREKYGPHTEHYIRVYGNQAVTQALASHERQPFPLRSVVAKEKFAGSPHGRAEGVAFMIKRETSQFPESAGWQFVYYPASGEARRTHEACAGCHRAAASTDYVFGQYPR